MDMTTTNNAVPVLLDRVVGMRFTADLATPFLTR